ncbi:MAG: hypothetical protein U9N85_01250, partial [Bacteroidota bacterium]|nr:hypothetical protein [Bacteroidota bacterium]
SNSKNNSNQRDIIEQKEANNKKNIKQLSKLAEQFQKEDLKWFGKVLTASITFFGALIVLQSFHYNTDKLTDISFLHQVLLMSATGLLGLGILTSAAFLRFAAHVAVRKFHNFQESLSKKGGDPSLLGPIYGRASKIFDFLKYVSFVILSLSLIVFIAYIVAITLY